MTKTKLNAAAWFVSHCDVKCKRDYIAKLLKDALGKYNLTVDIYGVFGTKSCPRIEMNECLRMLETDYYFYFAFENSLSEEYVTEKLLHALQHYTMPIVFGGANYTRYMPDSAYLKIHTFDIREIVKQIVDIITDRQKYFGYFRWTNHYTHYNEPEFPKTDYYCEFYRNINDVHLVKPTSIINNFQRR